MKGETIYQRLLDEYARSDLDLDPSNTDSDLIPDNLTKQQRQRDSQTTILYRQFIEAHKDKQGFIKNSKNHIRNACIAWVSVLILALILFAVHVLVFTDRQIADIVSLISVAVPLLVAIIGTLNIVTKHVFPEDEEKHITDIVKTILDNDLKNKLANIRRSDTDSEKQEEI